MPVRHPLPHQPENLLVLLRNGPKWAPLRKLPPGPVPPPAA